MKPEKIIFLDIDGVLNSRTFYAARQGMPKSMLTCTDDRIQPFQFREIDTVPLALLKYLVDQTGANIVISSTWRMGQDPLWFRLLFYRKGIEFKNDTIIGKTPVIPGKVRGDEIKSWIDENEFTGKYIIIDDDSDMLPEQKPFFVQTTHKLGFTWDEYEKSLALLGKIE